MSCECMFQWHESSFKPRLLMLWQFQSMKLKSVEFLLHFSDNVFCFFVDYCLGHVLVELVVFPKWCQFECLFAQPIFGTTACHCLIFHNENRICKNIYFRTEILTIPKVPATMTTGRKSPYDLYIFHTLPKCFHAQKKKLFFLFFSSLLLFLPLSHFHWAQ